MSVREPKITNLILKKILIKKNKKKYKAPLQLIVLCERGTLKPPSSVSVFFWLMLKHTFVEICQMFVCALYLRHMHARPNEANLYILLIIKGVYAKQVHR